VEHWRGAGVQVQHALGGIACHAQQARPAQRNGSLRGGGKGRGPEGETLNWLQGRARASRASRVPALPGWQDHP
jgi:hypothetical protein